MMMICGSDVSRQVGFNHRVHFRSIVAKNACLGTNNSNEDDCPAVSLLLYTINELTAINEPNFLPLSKNLQSVIEKGKASHRHISECIFDGEQVCYSNKIKCLKLNLDRIITMSLNVTISG